MLLTRLPAGRLPEPAPPLAASRWAWPLVGLPVGLIGWATLAGLGALGLPPLAAAAAALAAMALATGGLHHDGLADLADGLGGSDRERRLAIMRDSRIGSFGALALIFAVLLGVAGLAAAAPLPAGLLLVAVASRLAMLVVADLLPPARPEGLGHAAVGSGRRAWLPGLAAAALLAVSCGPAGPAVLLAVALAALAVARTARAALGGQTGDVLGAVQLAAETAGLLALAAAARAGA